MQNRGSSIKARWMAKRNFGPRSFENIMFETAIQLTTLSHHNVITCGLSKARRKDNRGRRNTKQ